MACYTYLHPDHRDTDIYKIGKANDVEQRHANLNTAYCNEIKERWFLYPKLDNAYSSGVLFFIEKTCHKFLEKVRINPNREFFKITDINKFLLDIIGHLHEIGIEVGLTRNIDELKELKDYSLQDEAVEISKVLNPYPYQLKILDKIRNWYISDAISGKIILPPGIGKSYITSFWLRELPEDTKVLILVPYVSIQDDFEIVVKNCKVKCSVDVIVNNTGWKGFEDEYDIIIYDEAHHMCSAKNREILKVKSKKKLFLTATEKTIHAEWELDMRKPIFGDYIYKMDIFEAIRLGYLVDYKIFLADWTLRLKNMVEQLRDVYHRRKIIMFANSVQMATEITNDLEELKLPVSIITADTGKTERREIINKFKSDEFHILCNVQCIGEGVNIPCIDTVMFMESRHSNIGVIQNIGRGLRKHPGKDFCMVIVKEEMLKNKFIENLLVYDSRLQNPGSMVIVNNTAKQKKDETYSIEGIVNIVEKFSSRKINDTWAFIEELKRQNILSKTEYYQSDLELLDVPELEFTGFSWDNLVKCKNPYPYEECVAKILELLPSVWEDLKKIGEKKDKLIYLYRIDDRIDPNLIERIKEDTRLGDVFKSRFTRHPIK